MASHPGHVREALGREPGWTGRKPQERARGRDEAAAGHRRRRERPRTLARARRREARPASPDESGFMPTPAVRRTFAPRGRTPTLGSGGRHDRTSAVSAATVGPARRPGPADRPPPDDTDVRGGDTVESLRERRRRRPVPLTTPRDKGHAHARSEAVRAYPAGRPSIEAEPFPGETPEANPDEGVRRHARHARPASSAPEGTAPPRPGPSRSRSRSGCIGGRGPWRRSSATPASRSELRP